MATAGKFNGKLFGVYSGSTLISHGTECSIEFTSDQIDTTSKDNGQWGDNIPGLKSCTISCSAMLAFDAVYGVSEIFAAITNNTALTMLFSTEVTGDKYFTGSFNPSQLSVNASNNDVASWSATFQNSGAITEATVA